MYVKQSDPRALPQASAGGVGSRHPLGTQQYLSHSPCLVVGLGPPRSLPWLNLLASGLKLPNLVLAVLRDGGRPGFFTCHPLSPTVSTHNPVFL